MKIKNISLALGLILALPSIGLISCGKKKEGYTVKVSVTDIGTARVYRDILEGKEVSKLDSNKNGAKITSVKVTYIDERGKKVEDKIQNLEVGKDFLKTYQVAAGKTIIVTAAAEGSEVADTLLGGKSEELATALADALANTKQLKWLKLVKEKKGLTQEELKTEVAKLAKEEEADDLKKAVDKATKAIAKEATKKGAATAVTLPTLSITIEKGGETIAAQSVKASKSNLTPQELTKAGQKTTVTATATAVAFDVK